MLYYDRIHISERIDVVKINSSKECIVCHYWFFNHVFKFQDSVSDGCHDLIISCLNISDIVIITVKGVAYCCVIHNISKSEAINLLKKYVLEDLCIYKICIPKISVSKIESGTVIFTI